MEMKKIHIGSDQNGSRVIVQHMVSLYTALRDPNSTKQVAQHSVMLWKKCCASTYDAMIVSSGTETAEPLMGTVHSPKQKIKWKGWDKNVYKSEVET